MVDGCSASYVGFTGVFGVYGLFVSRNVLNTSQLQYTPWCHIKYFFITTIAPIHDEKCSKTPKCISTCPYKFLWADVEIAAIKPAIGCPLGARFR